MNRSNPQFTPGNVKVFVACLLLFAILITPMAAIAAPRARIDSTVKKSSGRKEATNPSLSTELVPNPVVPICDPAPVVTNINDSGAGSLRDAIANVCADGTISFDPNLTSSAPVTITLTSGELPIDKSFTINGPTNNGLTISGNDESRIFNVSAGQNFTFSNLTISAGKAAQGGGINNLGNLTILNSTLNGNNADGNGGAIDTEGGVVKIINSTISGNTAVSGAGGGLYNGGTSQTRLTNVTIAANNEGVRQVSSNALLMNNTIVARNPNCAFCDQDDIFVDNTGNPAVTIDPASSNNLVGVDGNVIGITSGVNGNQIGSSEAPVNPLLGPLANNGGPTFTHSLSNFSPAIDTGNNSVAVDQNNAALTTDQRGSPRFENSVVDIGAFEKTFAPPPASADLSVIKAVGSEESLADQDVVYTITVMNGGPNDAATVVLQDQLPLDMTFISLPSVGGGWSCTTPMVGANGLIQCTNASVAVGSATVFTLTGHIPPSTPGGTNYHNVATVTSNTSDGESSNNESSANTVVVSCLTNPVVTTNADSGVGSLRQAIIGACPNSTISFDMTQVVSPIILNTGELIVDKNVTITGPGANLLTIDANQTSRVFNIGSGVTASISGLTIANGKVAGGYPNFGGGIFINSSGTLTLTDSTLSGNSCASDSLSGDDSTGGGIFIDSGGILTINNSTLSGNSVTGNLAATAASGGAISNAGTLTITNSTLSGNTVTGSSHNLGGAIINSGSGGNLTITNSTLSGNSVTTGSDFGGAIYSGGPLTLSNSTISGNSSTSDAGGISGDATIRNTIIAKNTSATNPDVEGTLTSQGHNLIGDSTGATITGDTTGNIVNQDPLLGPLQNNGGPTQTMALLLGSPALDAGDNCVLDNSCTPMLAAPVITDQRGGVFSRSVDGPDADTTATVDIGAFEAQVSLEDITDKTTNEDTQLQFDFNIGGSPSTVTATSSNPAVAPDPTLSGSGSTRTLTLNPVANQFGTSTITVTVSGGGESMTDTFVLTVSPVGDTPSVTNASTTVNTQSTSGLVITKNALDGAEISYFKITNITNGTLFQHDGATLINSGDFIAVADGNAGLKFTPVLNSMAAGSFDVQAAPANDGSGLSSAVTATITVNCGPTVVTTNANSGAGSLRDVILHACGGATITFTAGLASPITLTSGQLVIDKNLTITGPGANLLTISGNNASRVFNITSDTTGSITDLKLTHGSVSSAGINQGGAIFNAGALTLTNDTISDSFAQGSTNTSANAGGGIFNAASGTILMTGSTVSANFAQNGGSDHGAGIANLGTLTITNSTIKENGALIALGPGADAKGGGIYNEGTLTVASSSVSSNVVNGNGSNTINQGGGIFSLGNATITSSMLVGNVVSSSGSEGSGGGVCSLANKLVVVNSTITSNTVGNNNGNFGGGIENGGSSTLVLVSSTVTLNGVSGGSSAAGGGVRTAGPANVRNTIIANNSSNASPDVDGTFNSQGHNLIKSVSGSNGFGLNGDITGVDPLLRALGDYGGPTQTMGLLLGSPALDAGDNCVTDSLHCSDPDTPQLTFDQRGTPFARSVDGPDADTTATVDIGAFEAQVSIEDIPDKTINEDTQLQFSFNIGGGANVTSVTATSANTTLVPNNAANIALSGSGSTRTLTINPVANLFGTSTITVTVNGSNSQSMTDTFVLTVNPVPDTPSVTNASTTVNTQTTSGLVISRSPADGAEVTNFKISNITGGTLFKNDGTTQIDNGNFITVAEGNAGLKFTPALNSSADGSFQVQASLSANDAGLGGGLATATISVNCGGSVVTNSNDSGAGSLRAIINSACSGASITFDPALNGQTITLTSGQLVINKNLTITGPGANLLTISGNNASRVFDVNVSGGVVTISGLTIANGKINDGSPRGGGIHNQNGTLNITNSTLTNNSAGGVFDGVGGGIHNENGTLNVTNSTLSNNSVTGNHGGGGIFNSGTANVTNSTLSNNSGGAVGGGIFNQIGTLTVTNSTLNNNSITNGGGGICNQIGGTLNLINSTLNNNSVTGGTGGAGGGILNQNSTVNVTNSTLSNNTVTGSSSSGGSGGGISNNFGTLRVTNSTLSNNSVTGTGSFNTGGGIQTSNGTAQVRNSIIALNSASSRPDLDGSFTSSGHNLIGMSDGSTGFTNGVNGDIVGTIAAPVNPLLGPLANNGGVTQTLALLAGSPALDAGDNCVTDAAHCGNANIPQLTNDQRGAPFARLVDGPDADTTATVDIGAFEAQVSIEDITDKAINEDTQLQFTFNIGGGANITSVTATSSNTTLVPNDPVNNIVLSGSASTRTLTINPAPNQFGTSTITLTVNGSNSQSMTDTFVLTVSPIPDTPAVTNASTSVNAQTTSGLVISRSPADGAEVTNFKITNITGGTLFKNDGTTQIINNSFITFAEGNAGLKFTPPLNSTANGSFQVQASLSGNNGGLGGGVATATISVNCGATVVINSNDSGAGSLRDTILHACDSATITFDLTPGKVANPITLTSGELLMNKNLIIQGPGANILTVQRSAAAGTPSFSIFSNPAGLSLSVSGLTLSNADNPNNGGAIKNAGTLSLNSMALTNNHTAAGGSALFNSSAGTATVSNSTFSNNNSDTWAAIYNQGGALNLTNSTLTANTNLSSFPGAAVFGESFSTVTNITNCTISQNTGQAEVVFRNPGGPAVINLKNTIVSGNTGGDVNGTTDLGNNLIGGNALLAAFGSYGGPTQTMALLPGSPAINAGTAAGAPTTDQRGLSRVGAVDIGALESRGFTISAASGTPQSATILSAFGSPLIASVTGVGGEPVNGGIVIFTAPAASASAVLTGGGSTANVTVAGGQASINATANGVAGSYNVNASAVGATPASFSLTNNKAAVTTTAVASSLNPSDLNQSVTFTATVSGAVTPTGAIQFKDNGTNLGSPVVLNSSGVAQLTTSALTTGNHTITADYSGDGNLLASTGTLTGGQTVRFRPLIKFSQPTYSVNENGNVITITVIRLGDTSSAVTVDYATPDDSAALTVLPCSNANGVASPRCDFTTALGTLRFAAGETSKTFNVLISQDLWVEGNETAQLTLSNLTGGAAFQQPSDAIAVLTIVDDDTTPPSTNAIDDSTNFVRQQYHDFLNREPDTPGLNFWVNQIESCGADTQCRAVKRINVSAAFFLSIEFQNTGYFVERMYKAGFGDIAPPTVPVPVRFTNFLADGQEIKGNIIVGQGNWQQQIEDAKRAFALAFVQRTAFVNRYPAITSAEAFVDSLNTNAGLVLLDAERSALIAELSPNPADTTLRADVLQKVAENAVLQQQEFNRAFVLLQYFGYLRRNPDAAPEPTLNFAGYNFWLGKLNQANGDYVGAELIKAFITSGEYRQRFGP